MKNVISLQFGNVYQRRNPEYLVVSRLYTSPYYLWMTLVNERASLNVDDPVLEGYVCADTVSHFCLGLPDGEYEVSLYFFEPENNHGPFDVKINDNPALDSIEIHKGITDKKVFRCHSQNGILKLTFIPYNGCDFIINALTVCSDNEVNPVKVFENSPPVHMPDKSDFVKESFDEPYKVLKRLADWLIHNTHSNGFVGDFWNDSSGKNRYYWYTSSMPIRALLAAYDIYGDKKYIDACERMLDMFIGEQLPNGAWTDSFRGETTSNLGDSQIDEIIKKERQPMSDIGSVVTTLAVGSYYAGKYKRQLYIDAVKRYCDNWASKFQLPTGAFTDGIGLGDGVYSCATAIEAATYSIASKIIGEKEYMKVAENAISYLIPDWQEDGRVLGRAPHWLVRSRKPFVLDANYFGDQWYYDEGFITTARHTGNIVLKDRIINAIKKRIFGEKGLCSLLKGDSIWWPVQDIWSNAKSIGLVQTLLYIKLTGHSNSFLDEIIDNMIKVICSPKHARSVGIMIDRNEIPNSLGCLQAWGGMTMESTGFAGMTLAEVLKPGVIYLDFE